jgi:hypothetical protein
MKRVPLPEPSHHQTPISASDQASTPGCLCTFPSNRIRLCSASRPSVEHLEGADSTSSPRVYRPPPRVPSRLRPCPTLADPLVQHRLLLSSFSSCPNTARSGQWPTSNAAPWPRAHALPYPHKHAQVPESTLSFRLPPN